MLDDYAEHLTLARQALARFEHLAAQVAAKVPGHLPAATEEARKAVIATRSLAAWCERQTFERPQD